MKKEMFLFVLISLSFWMACTENEKKQLYFVGDKDNDLLQLLEANTFDVHRFDNVKDVLEVIPDNQALFIVADGYPARLNEFDDDFYSNIQEKALNVYIEYTENVPNMDINPDYRQTRLERGVVMENVFGEELPPMSILGINDCHILPTDVEDPLLVLAKVAGLDKAEYGLDGTEYYPLLFKHQDMIVAMTKLSDFATGRYGPEKSWKIVWAYIIGELLDKKDVQLEHWPSYLSPTFDRDEILTEADKENSILKGVQWFYNGRFFVHPSWKETWLKYQGDGTNPVGPPLDQSLPNGDGSMGLLEGHSSNIYYDGSQQYRYWIRADVQGEAAYALAAAGKYLEKKEFYTPAKNLVDYIFSSNLRTGPRSEKDSAAYGLIGWSDTHPHVYYGDDNARAILGILGASAHMGTDLWDKEMAEAILANFRTTGNQGFRGSRLENKNLQLLGWKHFWERDIVNPAPHFESWMWALYLWLYDKSGYEPLLVKVKNAIRITMEGYPEEWHWTNGIQQERARMILPLAWLVRVEDTKEHRDWLDLVVGKLLENQMDSGAIREELGGEGQGKYGRTKSNEEYGLHEAPLIFENGDPIADMLYTSNFAFFSLNEAAHATGDVRYQEALEKLSDFLTRIQVKSEKFPDLDGAWFRAFDYDRWEFWASNADVGWGAWGTLTGWTQSWIVATQVLVLQNQSYWELTQNSTLDRFMPQTIEILFEN